MDRYHFNIRDGQEFPDRDGTVLEDLGQARIEAVKVMAQALLSESVEFWEMGLLEVTVTDAKGLTLFSIRTYAQDAAALQR